MALEALFTVILGLVFTWILLSVSINVTNDWISVRLLKSAKDLQDTIESMLQNDTDLLRKFYDHIVIRSLTPRMKKQSAQIPVWLNNYPILRGYTKVRSVIPRAIPSTIFAEAMFDVFVYESLTPEESREELSVARIQTSIERLRSKKPHLSQVLGKLFIRLDRPAILDVKIAECKTNIENWYRYSTGYLTERQQLYDQVMAIVIGLIISLLLNVDMISMTMYLWREPTVRQVIVQSAGAFSLPREQLEANPEQAIYYFNQQFIGLQPPIGWMLNETDGLRAEFASDCQLFPAQNQAFGIPVFGTTYCIAPSQSNNQTNISLKLFGVLITAIAGRQGAPLWSNILRGLSHGYNREGKE